MGVPRMVVVDVGSKLLGKEGLTNPAVILDQMITALMTEKTERSLATLGAGDVLIRPDLGDITSGQFNRTAEAVAVGERAAEAKAHLARQRAQILRNQPALGRGLQRVTDGTGTAHGSGAGSTTRRRAVAGCGTPSTKR